MSTQRPSAPGTGPHGVYSRPVGADALRTTFTRDAGLWRTVDLSGVCDKTGLLRAFAQALEFPSGFGGNWDALADSLQDLSWLQWQRIALDVRGAQDIAHKAPADWRTALDILEEAATYWAERDRTFLVLVEGAGVRRALSA
jgi:hypothetical protein